MTISINENALCAPTTGRSILLDLGNTRLKVAIWQSENDTLAFLGAREHIDAPSLGKWLVHLLHENGIGGRVNAYGVSVAAESLMLHLAGVLEQEGLASGITWIRPQATMLGVTNGYPNPGQLGADRWLGILGLKKYFPSPDRSIVLANFGTATTVDTLSRDSKFLGGLILPGMTMMQNSLASGTARLPLAQGQVVDYPTDTHSAIMTGIVAAQLGAIHRQVVLSTKRDGRPPVLCVSGGAWKQLERASQSIFSELEVLELPHVVLDGLSLVAKSFSKPNHEKSDV